MNCELEKLDSKKQRRTKYGAPTRKQANCTHCGTTAKHLVVVGSKQLECSFCQKKF